MKDSQEIQDKLKPINLYELIGIILGDGCIYYNKSQRVYMLEITGNVNELEYYKRISTFIHTFTNKNQESELKKKKLDKV